MPEITRAPRDLRDSDLVDGTTGLLGETNFAAANRVRNNFASFINFARDENEKILITEHNKPAAAVVPVSEFRILKLLDRMGITDQLSELTYRDVTFDEAINTLTKIIESVQREESTTGEKDGESSPIESESDGIHPRGRRPRLGSVR